MPMYVLLKLDKSQDCETQVLGVYSTRALGVEQYHKAEALVAGKCDSGTIEIHLQKVAAVDTALNANDQHWSC